MRAAKYPDKILAKLTTFIIGETGTIVKNGTDGGRFLAQFANNRQIDK